MDRNDKEWFGKVSGLVKETKAHFANDARERAAAGKLPKSQNIILNEKEVQGYWDVTRVLETTLNGRHQITADDLAAFRQNMRVAQKRFGGGAGITARQVINLAGGKPLEYLHPKDGMDSDIDKARREITRCLAVSAANRTVRFITNASPESDVQRHVVIVDFLAYEEACARLASMYKPTEKDCRKLADWMRKQKLAFDCDCGRHRYFFRYIASIGGFAAGRKETGYPKIRNPGLNGVACKHVLRVMSEIERSGLVLRFLTKHLMNSSEYKASTRLTQKQTEQEAKEQARTKIDVDPSTLIKARILLKKAKNALFQAQKNTPPPKKITTASQVKTKSVAEKLSDKFFSVKNGLFKLFGK